MHGYFNTQSIKNITIYLPILSIHYCRRQERSKQTTDDKVVLLIMNDKVLTRTPTLDHVNQTLAPV